MSAPDVAAVLAAHMSTRGRAERIHPADGPNCGWAIVRVCKCGEWSAPVMHDDSDKVAHRAHVAEALKPVIAAAQAEAYREIADRLDTWEFPAGSDVLDAMYRLVGSLRDRADRIGGAS